MTDLYANKVCLAPMVRSGTLPLRLLSLRYGADLVYGEEIVDKRIISAVRVPNAVLDTVDFVSRSGDSVVFRTCPEEAGKVVFQIGTADAVLALKAAEHMCVSLRTRCFLQSATSSTLLYTDLLAVATADCLVSLCVACSARDVAAVDINMGCPKHFSIQGGMGAALLRKPEVACDQIVKTLRRNLNIPVSCKIRLLPNTQETVRRLSLSQSSIVLSILIVSLIHERPSNKASWEALAPVVSALSIPVLANGDVFLYEDLAKLRAISGASSFLIARGALANASIFRKEGRLSVAQVARDYLKVAAETDNVYQNTKYNVMRMLPSTIEEAYASGKDYQLANEGSDIVTVPDLAATRNSLQMYSLWSLQNYYEQHQDRFRAKAAALETQIEPQSHEDPTLTTLPGSHDRYAESAASETRETVQVRNNRVGKPEFYCETCKVQLLSQQDVALHTKGKKHKNVLRRQASATISKYVAKAAVKLEAPIDPVTAVNETQKHKATTEERGHEGEEERTTKRVKREDVAAPADALGSS
ncbi:hypothetical protein BBJ28_00009318 [Nothophytophthora sp. Chile5]|nr:hypothetical protein BBJ28_00009318 [Nothophytophthora sp. Chile5]